MRPGTRPARATAPLCVGIFAIAALSIPSAQARAQAPDPAIGISPLDATPIGALPPIALPMPASRNHNYWGIRVQAANRRGGEGPDLLAIAAGIDFQWRGGSVFGVTGGYQTRECEPADADCGDHALFGARARFNVITGGPTIAAVFGDHSATSTLGAEVGLGYAPAVDPGMDVCTLDLGVPFSLAMLQRVRLVAYATPGVAWDMGCSSSSDPSRATFLTSVGIGAQQVGLRGLDVYVGLKRIFRSAAGYRFGLSVTYVRLP